MMLNQTGRSRLPLSPIKTSPHCEYSVKLSHYYAIFPKLSHSTSLDHQKGHPLFFTSTSPNYTYQLKFLRSSSKTLADPSPPLPPQIHSSKLANVPPNLISSITEYPIVSSITLPSSSIDPLPCFHEIPFSQYTHIVSLFNSTKFHNVPFAHYAEGQCYEYGINIPRDLKKALTTYTKGSSNNELGCLFKLARISIEPELCHMFSQTCDPARTIALFLQIFSKHGLFDRFSTDNSSLCQYMLFNLYLDIFPNFKAFLLEAISADIEATLWIDTLAPNTSLQTRQAFKAFLGILAEEDLYSEKSIDYLQEITEISRNNNIEACFLLADLLDVSFFGVSAIHDLDRRITLYSKAESDGSSIVASRLIVLLESLESYMKIKKLNTESIRQSIELYYQKIQSTPTFELLKKQAASLLMKDDLKTYIHKARDYHHLLFYLGDQQSTIIFLQILQYLKSSDLMEMTELATKKKPCEFFEITKAYCLEKGLGAGADPIEALKIYQDVLLRPTQKSNEEWACRRAKLLYRIGAALLKTEEKGHAEFFFKFYTLEILYILQENINDPCCLYELYKITNTGRGVVKRTKTAGKLLENIVKLQSKSEAESLALLYAKKAQGKVKEVREIVEPKIEKRRSFRVRPGLHDTSLQREVLKLMEELTNELDTELMKFGVSDPENLQDGEYVRQTVQNRLSEVMKSLTNEYEELFQKLGSRWDDNVSSGSLIEETPSPMIKTSLSRSRLTPEVARSAMLRSSSGFRRDIESPLESRRSQEPKNRSQEGSAIFNRRKTEEMVHSNMLSSNLSFLTKGQSVKVLAAKEGLETTIRERVLERLMESRRVSYEILARDLFVLEKRKPLLNFLRIILNSHKEVMESLSPYKNSRVNQNFQKNNVVILELLEALTLDNKLKLIKESEFTIKESEIENKKIVTLNLNNQLFDVIQLEYPLVYITGQLLEYPLTFLIPLTFRHPQFFSIYGVSFSISPTSLHVTYLMEPRDSTFKHFLRLQTSKLNLKARLLIIQQIIRIFQAFHVHNIPLLTLDSDSLAVDSEGQIKLFDVFLPVFESPESIEETDTQQRKYKGVLEKLPVDIYSENGRLSIVSDMFCLGLIMYEVLSGRKIYGVDDFQNQFDYPERIKKGLLKQRVIYACKKGILMIPSLKQTTTFLDETIFGCLSYYKKKRPHIGSLLLTLHQAILGIQESQSKVQEQSSIFDKSVAKWKSESSYTMENFIKQQYSLVRFTESTQGEGEVEMLLSGTTTFKGKIKDRLPNGPGKLLILDTFEYTGDFYDGLPHGSGALNLAIRKEIITGRFFRGYPMEGIVSNQENWKQIWFEELSWIPTKNYRTKMITGFEGLDQRFMTNMEISGVTTQSDKQRLSLVKNYVIFLEKTAVGNNTKAQMVDCFGNFYYFPGGFMPQMAPSSLIVKKIGSIEMSMKIYKAKLNVDTVFGVDFSALDLISLSEEGKDVLQSCSQSNFEKVSRWFHFGLKHEGSMHCNQLQRGVILVNFRNYFWHDRHSGSYQGGSFMDGIKCLYLGDIVDEKADGLGIEYKDSLKRYEGEYRNRVPHGRGILYSKEGKVEFRGVFHKGKPNYGIYIDRSNRMYEGRFREISTVPSLESIVNQDPVAPVKTESSEEKVTALENMKIDSKDFPDLNIEEWRNHPVCDLAQTIKDSIEQSTAGELRAESKIEFEGVIRNYSENVKELRGKLQLHDQRFDGRFQLIYTDGSEYDGELRNGVREGYGIYKKADGTVFEGEWEAGVVKRTAAIKEENNRIKPVESRFLRQKSQEKAQSGFARLKIKDGGYYEGEVISGVMEGFGTLWGGAGSLYRGTMKNGKKEGIGCFWENKDKTSDYYEGEFKSDRKEGVGIVYINGRRIFKGRFVNNIPTIGKLMDGIEEVLVNRWDKGDGEIFYLGQVTINKMEEIVAEGWGKVFGVDRRIEGVFKDRVLEENTGVIYYDTSKRKRMKDKEITYFGEVLQGLEHGLGVKRYKDITVRSEDKEEGSPERGGLKKIQSYEGEFEEGVIKGKGKISYTGQVEDETWYKGEVNNKKEGIGELQIQTNVVYKGEFKADKREGRGILQKNGKNIMGVYVNGAIQKMVLYES